MHPWDIGVGSLDVKACLMVPEGGSEVPIPPQHMGGGGNSGTVEFELHVPELAPEPVCDTGCVLGIGCG
jgi:hypothetical protein